ncbi:chromosomal replication initiator protein DnaA [candidate division CSSED10-310 bacterium]|uniref:Chromosomal replication initiator protein DnaA n=1 Tax=candidate division CSSED10-310 bacterium TaxID=2855610 RepID=A0ABV6YV86_UNCC1
MKNLWSIVLDKVKSRVNEHIFETWFEPTEYLQFANNILSIRVPNSFFREWIQENFGETLQTILHNITSKQIAIDFLLPETDESKDGSDNGKIRENSSEPETLVPHNNFMLNRKYTFNNFVVGNANQFAHAAARAVAETPAEAYNPLFIYGGVGLGKTHLMHGIGHSILKKCPEKKLVYLPAEQFMNEMINAFRFSKVTDFREKYRNMDVLMIDDIQYLAGRERTQVEFFHTFNTLYESQKQIVISSDLFPKEIPTLEERLRSRFEWGLIADIQPPDLETKVAILYKKSELNNIPLPNDVALFIAENIKSNIRELEGCLIRVNAVAHLTQRKIDLHFARQVLKDIVEKEDQTVSVEMVQKAVAKHFGLKLSTMRSKTRTKDIAYPRQIAMFICRQLTKDSLPAIGKQFGGKDHTTVLYACDKIKRKLKTDITLKKNIDLLTAEIREM